MKLRKNKPDFRLEGGFFYTDDFWRGYEKYSACGVVFIRKPTAESYGTVSVFKDLYGNLWELEKTKK